MPSAMADASLNQATLDHMGWVLYWAVDSKQKQPALGSAHAESSRPSERAAERAAA